jgi:four helix bundle protein
MEQNVNSYRDLIVWQKSMQTVLLLYALTKEFPKEEIYGLVSQMRRAAVSIPSNIAEGKYRRTKKDYVQFLRIAYASGAELETQIEIAKRLGYGSPQAIEKSEVQLTEVMKMLHSMIRKLESS